jgi:putative ABC transport system ATP-binding protein
VARAIVTSPSIVLADEPTGNLDSRASTEVLRIFGHLNAQGRTVVLITHEEHVAQIAKRIVRLADGVIVEDRRSADVRGLSPRLRELFDLPQKAAT